MRPRFRDRTNDDLPLIERLPHAEHVRGSWGDSTATLRLLRESPASGNRQAIIEANGHDVGIVLWQHTRCEKLDMAGTDTPTSTIDIDIDMDMDIMISEFDAQGRGYGPAAINRVAELALSDRTLPFVMACARLDNLASQRALAKAGHRKDGEFDDDPNGMHVLLLRDHQAGQAA